MRLKNDIILNELDGQFVAVDARDSEDRFNGIVKLNKTAGFIAEQLRKETNMDEIVNAMTEKYEVSLEDARINAEKVVEAFRKAGLLDE